MTTAKTVGRIILWALRLGMTFIWPVLCLLTVLCLGTVWNELQAWKGDFTWLGISLILLGLTAIGGYIAWRSDLSFPGARPQIDQPRLALWAIGLFIIHCLCLASLLGLDWLNSASANENNTVGLTLYFVDDNTNHFFFLLAASSIIILFLILLVSIVKNLRQLRLLVGLISLFTVIYPVALAGFLIIDDRNSSPLWEMKQTTTGPDNKTYSFLREGLIDSEYSHGEPFASSQKYSALALHTGGSIFIKKVKIILLDKQTQNPHGALIQGTKHKDANLRQVSEKLLKEQNVG